MSSTRRLQLLQWSVAILLAALVLGGAALIHFGGVRGYRVTCRNAQAIACVLQQDTARGARRRQVSLGAGATARVEVATYPRNRPRVFLHLDDGATAVFAAEFEGGDEMARARSAAARLNQVFSSKVPASAVLDVRPASYMRPLIWGAFGFFVLMALVVLRELFKPARGSSRPAEAAPPRGAA